MRLVEAIRATFGRTAHVRREAWPPGSGAAINYLAGTERGLDVIWYTFGGRHMVMPTHDDQDADDWYACTLSAKPVVEDWRAALSIEDGEGIQSIGPGDRCDVTLDRRKLEGECTLAWPVPYTIMLAVADDVTDWPADGIMISLGCFVLSASGIDLPFHLLQVGCWYPSEGVRLYHLTVVSTRRDR